MSIIIKGMKMPENCVDCDIVHREENAYGDTLGFRCPLIWKGYIHDNTGRLPECPLVEINSPIDFQRFIYDELQRITEGGKE